MEVDRISQIGSVGPQATPSWPQGQARRRRFVEELEESQADAGREESEQNFSDKDSSDKDPSNQDQPSPTSEELSANASAQREDGVGLSLDIMA